MKIKNLFLKIKLPNKFILKLAIPFSALLGGVTHINEILEFYEKVCPATHFPSICPSEHNAIISESKAHLIQGKIYIQPNGNAPSENITISILQSESIALTNNNGEFQLELPEKLSKGNSIHLQIKTKDWIILNPFLGKIKLTKNFEESSLNVHIIQSSQTLLESPLFLKQLSTYLQGRKAKNFDPQKLSTSLDISAYHKDVADYYHISLKDLANKLPEFAKHIINNKELYGNDKELIAAAYYSNNDFEKAAPVYADNAREMQKKLNKSQSEFIKFKVKTAQAFIQSGDSFLSAQNAIKALSEYKEALKLIDRTHNFQLWVDTKQRQADANGLIALQNSKGNKVSEHMSSSVRIYTELIQLVSKKTQPVLWADLNYKLGISNSVTFFFGNQSIRAGKLGVAIQNIRSSLMIFSKERYPFEWARSQHKLGLFLNMQYITSDNKKLSLLKKAKEALENSLLVYSERDYPGLRAEAMGTLITTNSFLYPKKKVTERIINKNIELLNREIEINKRDNNLILLYINQNSLAGSYKSRAAIKKGKSQLKDYELSIKKYKSLLSGLSPNRSSFQWMQTKIELGQVYFEKAQLETDKERKIDLYKKSILEHREVLSANINNNYSGLVVDSLAMSLITLADLLDNQESKKKIQEALLVLKQRDRYRSVIPIQSNTTIGFAYEVLSKNAKGKKEKLEYLNKSIDAYKAYLSNADKEFFPNDWSKFNRVTGSLYLKKASQFAKGNEKNEIINNAIKFYEASITGGNNNKLKENIDGFLGLAYAYLFKAIRIDDEKIINDQVGKALEIYKAILDYSFENNDKNIQIISRSQIAQCLLIQSRSQAKKNSDALFYEAITSLKELLSFSHHNGFIDKSKLIYQAVIDEYWYKLNGIDKNETKLIIVDSLLEFNRFSIKPFPKNTYQKQWGRIQKETAHALVEKSNISSGELQKKYLRKSIDHFNLALTVTPKKSDYNSWLEIQEMLGNIYLGLSFLVEEKDVMFKKSVEYYDSALAIINPVLERKKWIGLSKSKAKALYDYGSSGINGEKYTTSLQKSVKIYKEILHEIDYRTDNNREEWGDLLLSMADAQSQLQYHIILPPKEITNHLKNALENYKRAVKVFTKEKNPYKWAKIKQQIGILLFELSTSNNYITEHKKALGAYNQALTIFTEEKYSEEWLNLHSSLASSFQSSIPKVVKKDVSGYIKKASQEYKLEASYYLKKGDKLKWVRLYEGQIGYFYSYVATLSEEKEKFYLKAIQNYSKAFDLFTIKNHPSDYLNTNNNIGNTYLDLFISLKDHSNDKYLEKAIKYFEIGLAVPIEDADSTIMLKNNLIRAHKWYVENGLDKNKKKYHLNKAIQYSKEVMNTYTPEKDSYSWVYAVSDLADLISLKEGSKTAIKLFKDKQQDISTSNTTMKAELFLMEYMFLDKFGKKELANEAHTKYKELLCSDPTNSCSDIF